MYKRQTSKCWLKSGHGRLGLIPAIGFSCNTYFYHFAERVDYSLFLDTLAQWGLLKSTLNYGRTVLNREDQKGAMIGRMNWLRFDLADLARAFERLAVSKTGLPLQLQEVLDEGMRFCYVNGTASDARKKLGLPETLPIYCKTGTSLYEEDGGINIRKTDGIFAGFIRDRALCLVYTREARGGSEAATIGLRVLSDYYRAGSAKKAGGQPGQQ